MSETKKAPVMAEVKNLNAERDQELVNMLMEFVKLAKEGELSDVAIIGKVRGAPITEFQWDSSSPLELIGALEMAKVEITTEILAESMAEDADEDDED